MLDVGLLVVGEWVVGVAERPLQLPRRIEAPASPPPRICRRLRFTAPCPPVRWGRVMEPTIDDETAMRAPSVPAPGASFVYLR